MLPERKRNLIIGGIAIVVIIIVVMGLWIVSNFIKSNSKDPELRSNDSYPNEYTYLGVLKNEEDVYQVYGISNEGKYLELRTFYDVQDARIINEKFVIYSDAVNEVRYEKDDNEFYFYELDSFYSNNYKIKLSKDYIVLTKDKEINFWKYGEARENGMKITDLVISDLLINDNRLYYVLKDGIYEYDMDDKSAAMIVPLGDNTRVELVRLSDAYIYFKIDGSLFSFNIQNKDMRNVDAIIEGEYTFVDVTEDGFMFMVSEESGNVLKMLSSNINKVVDYQYPIFDEKVVSSKRISKDNYYMKLVNASGTERNVIVDITKKEIMLELDNDYLYLVKVGEDEN